MLMNIMFYGYGKLTCRMSRYNLYSTLSFASGRVGRSRTSCASRHRYILYNANRRITRQLLLRRLKRLLLVPVTTFNTLYKPFNCGF